MDNIYDLVQALKSCEGTCSDSEDNLSDVEQYAHDAADAAESATERVRDIQSTLADAVELAEKVEAQEGDISKEDVKIFLISQISSISLIRQRLVEYAEKFDIDLTHEVK